MTPDLQQYFDTYLDLFNTAGWKLFVEDMEETLLGYSYDHCKEFADFVRVQSARQQLERVVNYEEYIRRSMENATEESELDQEDFDNG